MKTNKQTSILTLKGDSVEVPAEAETITVLPLGHVKSSKGDFDVDRESYEMMKQQIADRGVDLVVDYEHQTLTGDQAPAAGWVKELICSDDCIKARVEWTPAAAQYLANKEYRYLSPVVTVRKKDGKAIGLHSLALTNTPAIEHMAAIVNSSTFKEDTHTMDVMQQIAQLLGLEDGASEDEIIEAIKKTLGDLQQLKEGCAGGAAKPDDNKVVANKAVCELLGLKSGAPTEDVTAKIMLLKGGNIDGVNVLEQLEQLKKESAERKANDAVTIALKSGKITPAMKEWAITYALSDPTGFAAFTEKAPQAVPMSEIVTETPLKQDAVDESTALVCKQLGISTDDIKKYGKKEG